MNCRARGNPAVVYKWKLNGWDIPVLDTDDHYTMVGGNLMINNPEKSKDEGRYQCVAKNIYGSVVSRVVTIKFGYLDPFLTEERSAVSVKVGQGAVLLCAPPPHYPDDLSYRWLLNEFPIFITPDNRKFVSQTTGNLYISNVDPADKGNYSCFVSSASIAKSVFSKFISLAPQDEREKVRKYPADIKVQFPDTYALVGQNVSLECFALGNPNPKIVWRKVDAPFPSNYEISLSGLVFTIFNVQVEDEGLYECEALNIKGKDRHQARVYTEVFTIFNVQVEDEGLYECEALNIKGKDRHQARVYTEAYPEWAEHINDTEKDIGSDLTLSCEAKGIPKPTIRWLKNGIGYGKGDLKFYGLTLEDAGMYQCVAENKHGTIYANAELRVIEASKITLAPSNADVTVGEKATMQCHATRDPSLDLTYIWSVNSHVLDFDKEKEHYSRNLMNEDRGDLFIANVQLRHAGRYTCTAQTIVDNSSASADLVVRDSHYHIEVRAFNAAGYGPPSELYDIYTKKAPPSRPPKIVSKHIVGSRVSIVWEHVEPLANESRVEGYKVLYRQEGQPDGMLYSTGKHYIDVPVPKDGEYIVEVRAQSEGGDGAVAQVKITGNCFHLLIIYLFN
ncbi:UNVERIFIED_CONTAM: hypothetical protein FKN15_065005 [Acipenser sinensis]